MKSYDGLPISYPGWLMKSRVIVLVVLSVFVCAAVCAGLAAILDGFELSMNR